ncbi:sodium/solute symporter [Solicola gregarius]|uniref:Cation acetate symporter n=1 Tax=Solicola gregarius TaxID=2908642 RepID=A0AA46TM18_9ACTN|nr:cation acetate symporter [Solicola gregarius]UYM07776.1 cation acetate symporter [Solicola gregarius]
MNSTYSVVAVAVVALVTVVIGAFGLRISRTTSDFYVASRSVGPFWNASAIGGEYLSAASFLGFAGLILAYGADMLWYGVGWTAGYLILLVLVAAPLRRSGAYTIPDFAEARLESVPTRYVSTLLIVVIGWLYLMPQFQGAGLTLRTATGAPAWAGGALVASVVLVSVVAGGMRSITFVQAFQYWLKLTALLIPLVLLVRFWVGDGSPTPAEAGGTDWSEWLTPLSGRDHSLYRTYSLMAATFLGTMGLPHVLVRFYTNPDGRAARRTTLLVLGLLGIFYVLPTAYGVLGRIYASDLAGSGRTDAVVLELPARVIGGTTGELLGALLTAGAFAAFLSTSSGLAVSVAGALSQDLLSRRFSAVTAFRLATAFAILVPFVLAVSVDDINVATSVGLAFAVAASTFCPLLVLGIWWRGLTPYGAVAGLLGGGLASGGSVVATLADVAPSGLAGAMLNQPALWSVPLGFALMIGVSLASRRHVAPNVNRMMVRLHTPEHLDVDRGGWTPEHR